MVRAVWNSFFHSFMQDLMWELKGLGVALDKEFIRSVLQRSLDEELDRIINAHDVEDALSVTVKHLYPWCDPREVLEAWPCDGPCQFGVVLVRALDVSLENSECQYKILVFLCAFMNELVKKSVFAPPFRRPSSVATTLHRK